MRNTITKKLEMIYKLTKIDTLFLNCNNEIDTSFISLEYPNVIEKDINLIIAKITNRIEKQNLEQHIYEFLSNLDFRFLSCPIYTEKNQYYGSVILGPVALETLDFSKFENEINDENDEEQQILNTFLKSIDFFSIDSYEILSNFVYNTINNKFVEPKIVTDNTKANNNIETISNVDNYYDYDNFSAFLEHNFDLEDQLLHLVKTGNIKNLKSDNPFLKRSNEFIFKKRSNISLVRNLKNLCIVSNSLALRAALKGGLPNILGYHLSNKNVVLIEKTNNIDILLKLSNKIMEEFCSYVNEYSNIEYSKLIKKTVDYILNNLASHISVNEIAEYLYTNPSYLSRKFKKETGYSMSHFINNEKIKQAKLLIHQNKYTLSEISNKVGYNNYTNFALVFKKHTDLTPKEYKQKIIKEV